MRLGKLTLAAVAAATMATGLWTPSPASAESELEYVTALAGRYAQGVPTAEDEAYLTSHTDLASEIEDGRISTVNVQVAENAPVSSVVDQVSGVRTTCHQAFRYLNAKSVTGSLLYRYHQNVNWCETGTKITSSNFSDYFSDIAGASMRNPQTGLIHVLRKEAANHWEGYTGGSIENCIFKFGCIGTKYPAIKLSHYAGRKNFTYMWFNADNGDGWKHQ